MQFRVNPKGFMLVALATALARRKGRDEMDHESWSKEAQPFCENDDMVQRWWNHITAQGWKPTDKQAAEYAVLMYDGSNR